MNKIIEELSEKNTFNKIIYINIILFITINFFYVIIFLLQIDTDIIPYLGISSNIDTIKSRPWTILTYMFIHYDIFHLIINLCWFYFGGKIFINYLSVNSILSTYLMGGIIGAFVYIISYNTLPVFGSIKEDSFAIGASASVLAILFAAATRVPKFSVSILFGQKIQLKHIAIIAIIIDILSIPKGNAGGHIAHLGGALYGYIYICMRKININTNYIFDKIISSLSRKKTYYFSKKENDYEYNFRKKKEQDEIDSILDKISNSGYESLSNQEKEKLFNQK